MLPRMPRIRPRARSGTTITTGRTNGVANHCPVGRADRRRHQRLGLQRQPRQASSADSSGGGDLAQQSLAHDAAAARAMISRPRISASGHPVRERVQMQRAASSSQINITAQASAWAAVISATIGLQQDRQIVTGLGQPARRPVQQGDARHRRFGALDRRCRSASSKRRRSSAWPQYWATSCKNDRSFWSMVTADGCAVEAEAPARPASGPAPPRADTRSGVRVDPISRGSPVGVQMGIRGAADRPSDAIQIGAPAANRVQRRQARPGVQRQRSHQGQLARFGIPQRTHQPDRRLGLRPRRATTTAPRTDAPNAAATSSTTACVHLFGRDGIGDGGRDRGQP